MHTTDLNGGSGGVYLLVFDQFGLAVISGWEDGLTPLYIGDKYWIR
jgi:hypothetical protein